MELSDTSPKARDVYYRRLAEMTPSEQRLRRGCRTLEGWRQPSSSSAIRRDYPDADSNDQSSGSPQADTAKNSRARHIEDNDLGRDAFALSACSARTGRSSVRGGSGLWVAHYLASLLTNVKAMSTSW